MSKAKQFLFLIVMDPQGDNLENRQVYSFLRNLLYITNTQSMEADSKSTETKLHKMLKVPTFSK